MYSVLTTLSEYTYYTLLLLVFKIVESLPCILKRNCHERLEVIQSCFNVKYFNLSTEISVKR